jgi:hypothetical protein
VRTLSAQADFCRARYDFSVKVFLSYSGADAEVGESVRRHLSSAGYQVWDPKLEVQPGSNFARAIGDALDAADALVVLVSPEAMQSEWIRWELDLAMTSPRFKGRLLPVELRPTESLPWILRRFPVLKFAGEKSQRDIVVALNRIRDAA